MKITNLEQNSPEWLEYRKIRIGASDAPIIMGMSPFKTPYGLYLEKVGEQIQETNFAMARGHELEPLARTEFTRLARELWHNDLIEINPVVIQSEEYNWMIASLDGLDAITGIAVEIKCPGKKDHEAALSGVIPTKYFAQLQHQLLVLGYDEIAYFSYHPDYEPVILHCVRDNEFIKKMLQAEKDFMKCIQNKTAPPLCENDYEERYDIEFVDAAIRYGEIERRLLELQIEKEQVRGMLLGLSSDRNCSGGGIKITQHTRKGGIDYSKIPEIRGIDLEKYRKDPARFSSITVA